MSESEAVGHATGGSEDRAFLDDYRALDAGAGFVELSDRAEVELVGRDAQKLLHNLTTNDFNKLSPGQGREAFALDAKGKIVGHFFAFLGDGVATLESSPGQGERLRKHFDRYIIREDAQPFDRTAERAKLLVAGPLAAETLAKVAPGELPTQPYAHRPADESRLVWLRRTPWPRGGGWLIVAPRDQRDAWREKLAAAGARACGSAAWEAFRVESGLPLYGVDLSDENLAQEVDRNDVSISLTKGCYLGQETVARIDALGQVNKLLRVVRFAGESPVPAGTELRKGEKVVGKTASSSWSPRFGVVALAFVRREAAAPGTTVDSAAGVATVAKPPLAD